MDSTFKVILIVIFDRLVKLTLVTKEKYKMKVRRYPDHAMAPTKVILNYKNFPTLGK